MNKPKTVIWYFTGTGNSLAMAKEIASLYDACPVKPIAAELNKEKIRCDAEFVGLCFPLYFLSFPKPVMDFLDRLELAPGAKAFAVVTRGLAPMGGVRGPFLKYLADKKAKAAGCFYVTMLNNDVTLFKPDSPEEAAGKLKSIPHEAKRIVSALKSGQPRFDPEPLGWVRPFRHKSAYLNHLKDFGGHFSADGNCTACGICAKVCPTGNISLPAGRPVWGASCVLCEGCLNWCPAQAVQHGKATEGKGRYHHPDIGVRDIEGQKAEI
jgi:ferredoxin